MKIIQKIIVALALAFSVVSCNNSGNENLAQVNKTSTFKVWGNCEMCKETIESSLKINGIGKANWNTETKMIEVGYDSTKINLDKIQKSIASVGYDNETYKGDETAYNNLHECCKYERK
jgi:mercuric ion binding protein